MSSLASSSVTHPTMMQLELALAAAPLAEPPMTYDIAFMHRSLCVAGLPVRRPPEHEGHTAMFSRRGAGFNLKLLTPNIEIPDANMSIPIGVPWGPKARLLILWMASQSRQLSHSNRFLEIGPIKEWLREIGIGIAGDAINRTKEQLIKLSQTLFNVTVRHSDEAGEDMIAFRNDLFVEQGAIAHEDLLHFRDGCLDKIRWPDGIVLTENACRRFERDVVPIPMDRLRKIAHSATAIDIFLFLSYRLPLIPKGRPQLMTWRQFGSQFGPSHQQSPSRFKEHYGAAIRAALQAYPEARIEEEPDGLLLHYSDPAGLTRAYIASSPMPVKRANHTRKRYVTRQEAAMTTN